MSRTATAGYDAVATIDGVVVAHRVQGLFQTGALPDAFPLPALGPRGAVRLSLVSAFPHRRSDGGLAFAIVLDVGEVVGLPPTVPEIAPTAYVVIAYEMTEDETLEPQLDELSRDDVRLGLADSTFTTFGLDPDDVRDRVVAEVQAIDPARLRVRMRLSDPGLRLHVADVAIPPGSSSLSFGFSEPVGGFHAYPTRGQAEDLPDLVGPGETFVYRLSSSAFDRIVGEFMEQVFPSLDIEVPAEGEVTLSGITVSAPDENGRIRVYSTGGYHRHTFMWIRVRFSDPDRLDEARPANEYVDYAVYGHGLTADENGAFAAGWGDGMLPIWGDPQAGPWGIEPGDTVEIRAEYLSYRGGDIRARPPTITLRNGHIHIAGTADVDDPFPFEVEAEFTSELIPEPDLSTPARVSVRVSNTEVDIPWWADFLVWLTGFGFLAMMFATESLAGKLEAAFAGAFPDATRGLRGLGAIVFLDRITVDPDFLELAGQLHAGSITSGNRVSGRTAPGLLDESPTGARSALNLWSIADGPPSSSFSRLGEVGVAEALPPARRTTIPAPEGEPPEAPITVGQRGSGDLGIPSTLFKFERRRLAGSDWTRWVEYEESVKPLVRITGRYGRADERGVIEAEEGTAFGQRSGHYSGGASPRWAAEYAVQVDPRRLLTTAPLNISWGMSGLGEGTTTRGEFDGSRFVWSLDASNLNLEPPPPISRDSVHSLADYLQKRMAVVRMKEQYEREFHVIITVRVTDVFGRAASDTVSLHGFVGYPVQDSARGEMAERHQRMEGVGPGPLIQVPPGIAELRATEAMSLIAELRRRFQLDDVLGTYLSDRPPGEFDELP